VHGCRQEQNQQVFFFKQALAQKLYTLRSKVRGVNLNWRSQKEDRQAAPSFGGEPK